MTGASARLPLGGASDRLYEYAAFRLVPDVSRDERVNCGVVVLCKPAEFLGVRLRVEPALWLALAPDLDVDGVRAHLDGLAAVAAADPGGGPVAATGVAQRFHWLTSPSSTVVQPGPVHTGLAPPSVGWPAVLDGLARRLLSRSTAELDELR